MGQSTDAILFFGFCWTEETDSPWNIDKDYYDHDDQDNGEWEQRFARLKGLKNPNGGAAQRKLAATSTVEVGTHCSGECAMPFVAAKASKTRAYRGCPREITSLEVKPEWEAELRAFCALMGIPVGYLMPTWWLVSDWR
jgi:hypothetical protein